MAVMFTGTRHWKGASVWLLYIIGLTPGVWYFYLGATDSLGANPVKAFEQLLGLWTVRFLILTLAVSRHRFASETAFRPLHRVAPHFPYWPRYGTDRVPTRWRSKPLQVFQR